jgi:Ca-activated chloride channel family protein
MNWEFGGYAFLYGPALILLPILWYFIYRIRKQRLKKSGIYLPTLSIVHAPKSLKTRIMPLLPWLRYIALSLFIIAIARPVSVTKEEIVKGQGIDIGIVIDLSSSMLAKDFSPNRLEATKQLAREFVSKRVNDRIAIVTFAGEAFTQCPLTTDSRVVDQVLQGLQPGVLEDGTAIGMGLAAGVNRLRDSTVKSKIIILLTDGVNNAGYIEPLTAAKLAADMGIKVYVIGVGTQGQALAPISRTNDGQYIYGYTPVEIDEALMTQIAATTNGQYFRATDKDSLKRIYDQINNMEKSHIEKTVNKRNYDLFLRFVLAGILCLMIEIILRNTWLRTPIMVE